MFINNISDAKAQLSALIEKVLAGQEVVSEGHPLKG
jgi:antitoxin (DNA-binding transcriptional repressor) of toxin-antitoxin stability system